MVSDRITCTVRSHARVRVEVGAGGQKAEPPPRNVVGGSAHPGKQAGGERGAERPQPRTNREVLPGSRHSSVLSRASVRRSGAATATGPSPRATQQHGQNQQKMRQRTKPDPQRHGSTPPVKQYTRPASRRPRSTAHSDPLAEQRQSWLVCVLSTCAVLGCWLALRYSSPPPLLPPLLGHFFVDTPTW